MSKIRELLSILRCPKCRSADLSLLQDDDCLECLTCKVRFPSSKGRPILISPDNGLFSIDDYLGAGAARNEVRLGLIKRFTPSPSVNMARSSMFLRLLESLDGRETQKILVVGGGNQREKLLDELQEHRGLSFVFTDIDVRADIDVFCDGHELPFRDGVFDAVITTAVLEHVLYPERVASEIARVLKIGGVLYSELPFMQQVHEGAYDFTRFTLSGHRRLFNEFSEIESGLVAGPGTALVWALESFFLAFVIRPASYKITKFVVRLLFGWIKYFDYLLRDKAAAIDGASCTYLLGRKSPEKIADERIVSMYRGAHRVRHT